MDITTLKGKTLDDETFAALKTHLDELAGQRDAARTESIDGRKKLKAEVEQLRGLKATLFEKLGLDDDADLNDLPEIKGQAEAAKQFEQRIKRLEREKADAAQKAADIEGKYKGSRLDAALAKALGAHEFVDTELVSSFIGGRVQWEDDQIMFADNGKLMPLEDGVKLIAQSKPHLLKAQGKSGSGHQTGAAGSQTSKQQYTRADFDALSPQQRLEAVKGGATLI